MRSYQKMLIVLWGMLLALAACNLPGAPTPTVEILQPTSATVIAPIATSPESSAPLETPGDLPQTMAALTLAAQAAGTPTAAQTADAQPASTQTPAAPLPQALPSQPAGSLTTTLPPKPAGPQLAFLKDKDIWLLDQPGGKPYPLTVAGDILSFAWSPDGERIAVYNGKQLCFINRDGSVRSACLPLGLDDPVAQVERRIAWSPDQRWLVLWNPVNPWDENAIGWIVLSLDNDAVSFRIQDPVDWGASLAPNNEAGGFTGEPLFLADGRLVGTLTHRLLCGSGGCHYQLFQFDVQKRSFLPYPNKPDDGWSEGQHLALSGDMTSLTNYGVFFFACDSYVTFVDRFTLADQTRHSWNLDNQAVANLALDPHTGQAILARTAVCAAADQPVWAQTCGLTQGFDVFAMQWWKSEGEFIDLPPGLTPAWSPDGQLVAFRSCLKQGSDGHWNPSQDVPASIYLWNPADSSLQLIEAGQQPQWRPK